MATRAQLTDAQAEVLRNLISIFGDSGCDFGPREVYPAHTNQDNAARRTCAALERLGVLLHSPDVSAYAIVYRINWSAAQAAL